MLVMATAVGWYLYNTFGTSTGGQERLTTAPATLSLEDELRLVVSNPGPQPLVIRFITLMENGTRVDGP